jgi:hypothetical protein
MSRPLIMPRRLAIALLAEAQKSAGAPVQGLIGARDGVPVAVLPGAVTVPEGQSLWARYDSGDAPAGTGRRLLISLDTKSVLQLRCQEGAGPATVERELRIL